MFELYLELTYDTLAGLLTWFGYIQTEHSARAPPTGYPTLETKSTFESLFFF